MTGPNPDPRDVETRPISVAELLAKNGNIGSPPVTGRRRRRRGNADAVTVAELTGEIPIIRAELLRDDDTRDDETRDEPSEPDAPVSGVLPVGPPPGFVDEDRPATGPRPVEPRPVERRWPKSPPQGPRGSGPQPSSYPRPQRRSEQPAAETARPEAVRSTGSGAERMRPDPVDTYAALEVDVMGSNVRDADPSAQDSAYVRSYLNRLGADRSSRSDLSESPAGDVADVMSEVGDDDWAGDHVGPPGLIGGALVVLQSILAVAFGGGLFIAFDQLWRWNSIVALVLTGLVTLGLVAAVQAVRKTADIVSTLIAVAVGLLVTLGPLALHAN